MAAQKPAIQLEFAQMYRRFGSEVTVVEMAPRLVHREDPDVSAAISEILEAEGIHLRTKAECIRVAKNGDDVLVGVDCVEGPPEIRGSHLLLVGRRPNTDDLGLDRAAIAQDPHGYIVVDDQFRTNVPGVWALGECNGKGAFTHTAYNDFESWLRTCLTATRAGSATASLPMPSISIRRSAEPVGPRTRCDAAARRR